MPETVVTTARLRLRTWQDADLGLLDRHLNTAEVKRHIGGVQEPERLAAGLAKMRSNWEADGYSFLAVERAEDGLFLGTCGLGRIETVEAPEALQGAIQIGWQLRSDCRGQGYATEAAQAMLAFGFGRFGWPAIFAQTSESNAPSWRLMQRLGMRRRAELDYADPDYPPEDNPTMIWSMDREDFAA